MAVILKFATARRRRARPVKPSEHKGEVVFFSGVRIDRTGQLKAEAIPPLQTRAPKPGRGY